MAVRSVSDSVPSLEELGVPPVVKGFDAKISGTCSGNRSDGEWEKHHAGSYAGSGESRTAEPTLFHLKIPLNCCIRTRRVWFLSRKWVPMSRIFRWPLRGILRQDPDVVFLGELRDRETIQAALTMAETGHLTVATLHTNSAIQSLTRLISVFPAHQQPEVRSQLSMVLEGILSQRLVSRWEGTGRVLALEILILSPAIRNLIREDKLHQVYSMMQTWQAQYGMQTMNQALTDLVSQKMIACELAMGLTIFPEELTKLLERSGRVRSSSKLLAQVAANGIGIKVGKISIGQAILTSGQ